MKKLILLSLIVLPSAAWGSNVDDCIKRGTKFAIEKACPAQKQEILDTIKAYEADGFTLEKLQQMTGIDYETILNRTDKECAASAEMQNEISAICIQNPRYMFE